VVRLDWTACEVDGFAFYKVLRSTTSESPSYLPWHDGTDVITTITDMGTTQQETSQPDAGHTAWFRAQGFSHTADGTVLLGQSAVVSVSVP
jgi:hypothetical protein